MVLLSDGVELRLRAPTRLRQSSGGSRNCTPTPGLLPPVTRWISPTSSTGVPRLRLIPAGERREASGEYFTSYRMRGLVDLLRGRYPDRYLVLDAPPIGASPDARILSELADTAVIVAGYGVDTVTAIKESVAVLEPGRLAGVVFNGVP